MLLRAQKQLAEAKKEETKEEKKAIDDDKDSELSETSLKSDESENEG